MGMIYFFTHFEQELAKSDDDSKIPPLIVAIVNGCIALSGLPSFDLIITSITNQWVAKGFTV